MTNVAIDLKRRFSSVLTRCLTIHMICLSVSLWQEPASAQAKLSLGFAIGYGSVSMSEVNSDLRDSYQVLLSAGIPVQTPKDLPGGLFLDGSILYRPSLLFFGGSVDYISSSGDISYSDASGSFQEKYDTKTIEVLANFGTSIPVDSSVSFFARLAAGYGRASSNHIGRLIIFSSQQNSIDVTNDVSGGYFAGRVQGGVEIVVRPRNEAPPTPIQRRARLSDCKGRRTQRTDDL